MHCKLITQWVEDGREQTAEQTLDQHRITIGRGGGNTCVLKDPTRVVSTKHAELREKHGVWNLIDVGSTNGTMLNGARIIPSQEHPLHDGDRIAVGSYELLFRCATGVATPPAGSADVPCTSSSSEGPASDSERLRYLLQRAYGKWDPASDTDVEQYLDHVLCRAIDGYDDGRARAAIQSLRTALCSSTGDAVAMEKPTPVSNVDVASGQARRLSRGRKWLTDDAASRVGEKLALFGSTLNSEQLASQLAAVLQVVCAGLADAVRGRRAFQKEFEVEATRILAWTPNPIKSAEDAEEIASILLDPRSKGLSDEQATASLTEAFHDLTVHQLGLMAGFRECIRGLLKELDPDKLEKGTGNRSKEKGLGLLGGRTVRTEAAAWRRYKDTHRQLCEEEVKVFERILAPYFAKGYLSVHKTRTRS
ncbi:MAG: type VI secretion system-associated FHA domain protein TagH [Nitrospira sp.]|nr:type VI secretion system-associated FHA domain protein TagH [Nitrospira sp.]MDH4243225.1 type VI secretion system-associated FHA domain protein TagH [Nitrospira sp.]MDH4356026.1 type VI secretion system-associated FHA domain protein TagH [Nitrospira sp.]MDH5317429.1 type VI secretion system-associated FHA domain protein TagH [Nitrospira sp.]